MPFRNCGSSTCKFREVSRKPVADAVTAATKVFPELSELGWPERGSGAEIGSLLLQAGKFVPTKAPSNLEQAYNNLLSRYPRSKPLACFRQGTWSFDAIFEQVVSKATSAEINRKGQSRGPPLPPRHHQQGLNGATHAVRSCLCNWESATPSLLRGYTRSISH
ncbi:ORF [Southern cowpea mosaic virus]|nr:ORF [Southern cowpea mosaic virus]